MARNIQQTQGWRAKFRVAFRGIAVGARGQSSFCVHFFFALLVCLAAAVLHVDRGEWCLLLLAIAMVLTAELLNTGLEWLAQVITDEHDTRIANALDIGSGAVLVASLGAAAIGAIIFAPRLWALWG